MQTTPLRKVLCIGALMLFVFVISARSSVEATSNQRAGFTAIQTNGGAPQTIAVAPKQAKIRMIASWYGQKFQGRLTSSGEIFDLHKLTAASKTLPIGTLVILTSPITGRTVVVRINDRGPWLKGRDLDLSEAAAIKLGIHEKGVAALEASLSN